jgi:threonine dehydrogenase-like Zn-dependent dehydrogenase
MSTVRALVYGVPPEQGETRPEPADEFTELLAGLPFGMHEVSDARPVRPDWVVTRPVLAGICGSDSKLLLGEFSDGDMDSPLSAFSSLPFVPGHEAVAEVVELGPEARGLESGQRVVLNPWLTCGPRGIEPACPPCKAGDLSLCWSTTRGEFGAGLHVGVMTKAPGAWAEYLAAHDSMLIPVPDGVSDAAAVLADPFAVSLHAILRHPPRPGGRAVVYGAGALGLTSLAVLRALHPDVDVAVVARFPAQADMARAFGAALVLPHEPRPELVEALADWSGGVLHRPLAGLPVTQPGHIDVVYDTVGLAESLEVGVRVLAERGELVCSGVATPKRWESTPVYLKELSVIGSNAYGVEELDGSRKNAVAHYLDLAAAGRVDVTPILTHRFRLGDWASAIRALARPGESGALKVAFTPGEP